MKTKLTLLGIILIVLGILTGTIFIQRARIQSLNNHLADAVNNDIVFVS